MSEFDVIGKITLEEIAKFALKNCKECPLYGKSCYHVCCDADDLLEDIKMEEKYEE